MATRIYLSPAAHEYDNPCACGDGENEHCNAYMDELEPYLLACGFEVKRGRRDAAGSDEVQRRVREANAWGADLYYVCHTNAFNGTVRGSRPHVYPAGDGAAWAEVLLRYRREVYDQPSRVYPTEDLYEINQTAMPCVYEEMVFHDNPDDAAFFHSHLRELAEATARGLCDIFGRSFVDPHRLPGDVNGDGKVNVADVRTVLRATVGKTVLTDDQTQAGDVNGDGKVNVADARQLLRKTVNKA